MLGVGPAPIPHKRLSVESLAAAIRTAINDESMRNRAAALGEKIRAEDGVGEAVRVIVMTESD
jgi:sterol 3beta-glucosyltransferase